MTQEFYLAVLNVHLYTTFEIIPFIPTLIYFVLISKFEIFDMILLKPELLSYVFIY